MLLEKIIIVLTLNVLVSILTVRGESNGTCGFFGTTGENEILFLVLLVVVALLILVQAIAFAIIASKVLRAVRSYKEVSNTRRSRSTDHISSYYTTPASEGGIEMIETQGTDSKHHTFMSSLDSTYQGPTNEGFRGNDEAEIAHEPNQRRKSRFSKMPDSGKNNGSQAWGLY